MREPPGPVKSSKGPLPSVIRPATRILLHGLAACVSAIALIIAAGAWRLAQGPVPLTFLTPYIVDSFRQIEAPFRFDVADTILVWAGWRRALDIVLLDVRVSSPDGTTAVIPEVSVGLSLPAFLHGIVAPSRLEIISARLRVVRAADGSFAFDLGTGEGEVSNASDLLFSGLLAPPDPETAIGYLREISIRNADLKIDDRRLGVSWHAPDASVSFRRNAKGITGAATLTLRIGDERASVSATGRYRASDGETALRLAFSDLQPKWLVGGNADWAFLRGLRMPVSGDAEIQLDGKGAVRSVAFNLATEGGEAALGDWFDAPLKIASAEARGVYQTDRGRLRIENAAIDLGGPRVALDLALEGLGGALAATGSARIEDLPLDDLAHYWPARIAPNTRAWIVTNLTDGLIRRVEASVNLRPGDLDAETLPDEAIVTRIEVAGANVHYLRPLPPIEGVDATVTITGERVEIATRGGQTRGLKTGDGRLLIAKKGDDFVMDIDLPVQGPVADALDLLARKPLAYTQAVGLKPEAASGTVAARLHFSFPLIADLDQEAISVAVEARLADFALSGLIEGYDLSQGALALALDNTRIEANGTAAINGVPAEIAWRQDFTGLREQRYRIKGRFTDSQRLGLGIPGNDYVTGPTPIEIEIVENAKGAWRLDAAANLREARVRLPAIFWDKKPGEDGVLTVHLVRDANRALRVKRFSLAAGDLVAEGGAEIDAATGGLRRLEISRLATGETDIAGVVSFGEDDAVKVAVVGESIDLRPYISTTGRKEEAQQAPLAISLKVSRAVLYNGVEAVNVVATMRRRNGRWEELKANATLPQGKRVVIDIARTRNGRLLWVGSDDAGAVLRALDVYDNAIGGKLALTARLDNGETDLVKGELKIADFRVIKAPFLAKLLSVASLGGVIDLLKQEKGLPFTRLIIPYEKRGDILTLTDMRIYGPAIGLTGKGTVDLDKGELDLAGTLVPAYTLNSVFGKLPILGNILTGAKGGGLIAMSYRATGPLDDPKTTVNPLTALVPGFLQKIFSSTRKDAREVDPFAIRNPDSSR